METSTRKIHFRAVFRKYIQKKTILNWFGRVGLQTLNQLIIHKWKIDKKDLINTGICGILNILLLSRQFLYQLGA